MRRHHVLLHWLKYRHKDVELGETLRFLFDLPFRKKGRIKVSKIENEENFYKVTFKGLSAPIYWPQAFPIDTLYQVATEILYKNWWNYEYESNKVSEEDVVVDCGAAEGFFSIFVSSRCKKIFAIEPNPLFIEGMKKSFKDIGNIEVLPIGVGSEKRTAMFSQNGIMSKFDEKDGFHVEVDTLDNVFYSKGIPFSFLKADIEGYELEMLRGAEKCLNNFKPKLSITTYHYKNDFNQIRTFLKERFPFYKIKGVGIEDRFGGPIMLHAHA